MNEEKFKACLGFFSDESIKVQREWLQACIEWLIEDNQRVFSTNELCKLAYEQWLLADLREIAEASFPSKSSLKTNKELRGNFSVQVNSVIDIGHSAYSQVQRLEGKELDHNDTEDENEAKEFFKSCAENTKTDRKSRNWKETSNRMLFFELHDGKQIIEAIEYQQINQLSLEKLEPGCKLLLTGPVLCRDGILLLKSCNVKYLGGNVELLMENNSQLKLLNNILKSNNSKKPESMNDNGRALNRKRASSNTNTRNRSRPKKETSSKIANTKTTGLNSDGQKNTQTKQPSSRNDKSKMAKPSAGLHVDIIDDFDDDFIGQLDDEMFKNQSNTVGKPAEICEISCMKQHKENANNQDLEIPDSLFEDDFFLTDDLQQLKEGVVRNVVRNVEGFESKVPRRKDLTDDSNKETLDILDDPFLDDFLADDNEVEVISVAKMVEGRNPLKKRFSVKASFKTLLSGLDFTSGFKLFALLSDNDQMVNVLIGDEALAGVIGYTASKVRQAVSNQLESDEKLKVKKALDIASKSLEMNKWLMEIEFNKNENIYEVLFMKPVYF